MPPGSPQAKKLHHLHAQLSLGQRCHRQKSLVSMYAGSLWSCPTLCNPVDCGLPGFSVRERGVSRQEYWSILANTGCHTLLSSVQFSSVAQSYPTLCDPMNCSMPGLPVHHQLPEVAQTHSHRVNDAIQPSHPLLSPSPPAPNLEHYISCCPSHQFP